MIELDIAGAPVLHHGASVVVKAGPWEGQTGSVVGWYTHNSSVVVAFGAGTTICIPADALESAAGRCPG